MIPSSSLAILRALRSIFRLFARAKEHRQQVLPHSDSRRLIDAEDLGVIVLAKDYYNTVRKEMPDKSRPKTIVALLRMLEDNGFIYRRRVSVEEDKSGALIARMLRATILGLPQAV
jgi:hypothetical protein